MIGGSIDNSTPLLDHVQVAAHCLLFSGPGRALRDTLARPLPLLEYCRRTLPLLRQHASFSGPPGSLDGFDGSSRGKGLNGLSLPGYSRGTPLLVAASLPLLLAATPWLHPRSHLECIESFRGALSDLREAISAVQSPPQPQPTSPPTSPRFGSFADAAGVNNDQKPVSDLALWTLTVMAAVLARVLASGPHGAPIRQTSIKMEAVARASQKVAELLAGEWIRSSIDAGRAGWLLGLYTTTQSNLAAIPHRTTAAALLAPLHSLDPHAPLPASAMTLLAYPLHIIATAPSAPVSLGVPIPSLLHALHRAVCAATAHFIDPPASAAHAWALVHALGGLRRADTVREAGYYPAFVLTLARSLVVYLRGPLRARSPWLDGGSDDQDEKIPVEAVRRAVLMWIVAVQVAHAPAAGVSADKWLMVINRVVGRGTVSTDDLAVLEYAVDAVEAKLISYPSPLVK